MHTYRVGFPVLESQKDKHRWRFFQAAGLRQARLHQGADFAHLDQLPQELWTILSCPTQGVHFNARALALLDSDKDGRIRVPELLAGVQWVCRRLKDPAVLLADSPVLKLEALADAPEGRALHEIARRVLADIGHPTGEAITWEDVASRDQLLARTPFNGDGIITPESGASPAQQQLIAEVIACCGGERDRCGATGLDQAHLDRFFAEARAHVAWMAQSEQDAAILPLGDGTAPAGTAISAVRMKVADYFTRCRLVAFDPGATDPLNGREADYDALARLELDSGCGEIAALPLAQAGAGRPLPLGPALNPYWAKAVASLVDHALVPLLGGTFTELTEAAWEQVLAKIAPYEAWMAAKAGAEVASLGVLRLREILAGDGYAQIGALLQRDRSFATEVGQLADLEKMIVYHEHLNRLLNNYVNFSDYHDVRFKAIFRVGRLYMDGRLCDLCVDVRDVNSHATLATAGKIFLAYCELTRPITQAKRFVCVAVTSGFAASLWVGRNGIFYDRDGNDWEAVIVKIIESPISLKEAFWSPWIKISTMIGDQVRKLLTSKQDAMLSATAKQIDATATTVAVGAKPAAPPKLEGAALASSVAVIGIAIGLLGSAVGGLISVVSGLPLWKSLAGVLAIFLAVSGPSVVLAYFKLRARDLAPVLNACGWAVNCRIRMTMRLGRTFTREACIPPGSELELGDPYAESRRGRNWFCVLLVVALVLFLYWRMGWLNRWLPSVWERVPAPAASAVEPQASGGSHVL